MKAVFAATRVEAEQHILEYARRYGGQWKAFGRLTDPCGYCFDEIVFIDIFFGQTLTAARTTQDWINNIAITRLQPGGVARHA